MAGVFAEEGGRTTLTVTVEYPSKEIRDMVLQSGMEHGAAESYDKLAELLVMERAPAGRLRLGLKCVL